MKFVLDFFVGKIPAPYSILIKNFTLPEEDLNIGLDEDEEAIFFLNGFSNISRSGGIEHLWNEEE